MNDLHIDDLAQNIPPHMRERILHISPRYKNIIEPDSNDAIKQFSYSFDAGSDDKRRIVMDAIESELLLYGVIPKVAMQVAQATDEFSQNVAEHCFGWKDGNLIEVNMILPPNHVITSVVAESPAIAGYDFRQHKKSITEYLSLMKEMELKYGGLNKSTIMKSADMARLWDKRGRGGALAAQHGHLLYAHQPWPTQLDMIYIRALNHPEDFVHKKDIQ